MSGARSSTGRLFQIPGPWTAKVRLPYFVLHTVKYMCNYKYSSLRLCCMACCCGSVVECLHPETSIPIYRWRQMHHGQLGGSFINNCTLSFNTKSVNFVQKLIDNYYDLQSQRYGFVVAWHMLAYFQYSNLLVKQYACLEVFGNCNITYCAG